LLVLEHRYDEDRAGTGEIGERGQLRVRFPEALGLLQIGNMDDLFRRNRPARSCFRIKSMRAALPEFEERGRGTLHRSGVEQPAVVKKQVRKLCRANASGVGED
jgi:hypothetical protein